MRRMDYRINLLLVMIVVGLMGLVSNQGWSEEKKRYENIPVDRFVGMMDQKDFTLINVHIPYQGEIPGTDLLIPFNNIDQHKSDLPNPKDKTIVVYCMAGPMGYVAAEKLVEMGYSRVIHFEGGMRAWRNSGRPLRFRPK